MQVRTGIEPLDARIGGLKPGAVYLLAGGPSAGTLTAVLQFLHAGLELGERVGLLTGHSPEEVLEEGRHWGFGLDQAWHQNRLRLLGYRGDFLQRIVQAGEPREVFEELTALLGGPVTRLALDPGTPLWESRATPADAQHFLDWCAQSGVTIWGTLTTDPG